MLTALRQIAAVAATSLRSLPQRRASSLVAVAGIAGVVAVFVAVLSIAAGFRAVMASTGEEDTAIVLRAGADTEMSSDLSLAETRVIADAPQVARGVAGAAVVSAELFVVVDVPKRATGTDANVPLRGVQPAAFELRAVRILEGRPFEPGRNELLVGEAAAAQFAGLEVGSVQRWGGGEWTVVGVFTTGGTAADSELWCDARVLQPTYRRGDSFQSVYAKLVSPEAQQDFKDLLTSDPRLKVQVLKESDYYAEQSVALTTLVSRLGGIIALLMGIGATFGALNTMYTAVASRSREVATLRALGFGPVPVVLSVLVEALLLSLAGGLIGGALAYLAFHGYETSTMNWQSFSQIAFSFRVTPELFGQGIAYALAMGGVGGLFPALRAARQPVAAALREL